MKHHFVEKTWGSEEWIVNNEKYCGKILRFRKDTSCSWHYHKIKDEVMYVHTGKVKIIYGYNENINDISNKEVILEKGDSFHIPTGLIHKICALQETEMFEFSTQHFEEDSFRIL